MSFLLTAPVELRQIAYAGGGRRSRSCRNVSACRAGILWEALSIAKQLDQPCLAF